MDENKTEEGKMKKEICYLCDPDKNTGCTKKYCAYNPDADIRACFSTTEKEYARLDFAGQPCENPDINGTNTHRVKENFEEDGPMVVPAEYLDANTMMGQKKTEETEGTT